MAPCARPDHPKPESQNPSCQAPKSLKPRVANGSLQHLHQGRVVQLQVDGDNAGQGQLPQQVQLASGDWVPGMGVSEN